MKQFSQAEIDGYIDGGGDICPFCGSDNIISNGFGSMEGGIGVEGADCEDCGENWEYIYTLIGIYINDENRYKTEIPHPATALTAEDWTEIYYALVDKQARIDKGDYGEDDELPEDKSSQKEWSDHIATIIGIIGGDGENMAKVS
jgi:hypothetical protein